MVSPGKKFEEDFRKSVPEDHWVYRFKDGTGNFSGTKNENVRFQAKNICDFEVMGDKYLFLLELKSHTGSSIPFSCIRNNQIVGMSEVKHKNIKALFILNFRDKEKTYAVYANDLREYMSSTDRKSIPINWVEENGIEIKSQKKKVHYRYDLERFFKEISLGED